VRECISDLLKAHGLLLKLNSIDGLFDRGKRNKTDTDVRPGTSVDPVVYGPHFDGCSPCKKAVYHL
jgi:hypothetical protein